MSIVKPTYEVLGHVPGAEVSAEIRRIQERELEIPVLLQHDTSLRIKIIDACGFACTFCHNEGTPVTVDHTGRQPVEFSPRGRSGRVSIFVPNNGVNFVSDKIEADDAFVGTIRQLQDHFPIDEIHLTGGEPTLHHGLVDIVSTLTGMGIAAKITSNGEKFAPLAEQLAAAGLNKVVFSVFGTSATELAAIQGGRFANEEFAARKLAALEESITAALAHRIPVGLNIVLPDASHADRVRHVIERFGDRCRVRILNSLDEGSASYDAVYELLADLRADPQCVNITAGASGMSVDYRLPDGKIVSFKQIRKSHLPDTCGDCSLRETGCEEGYYGMRLYKGGDQVYRLGVCIQRMDLTKPVEEFLNSGLPEEIVNHRLAEYKKIRDNILN